MATINNSFSRVSVNGSSDADTITNTGAYVTVNAGGGNDSVYNGSDDVTVYGGAGDDTINNWAGGWGDKIFGEAGNDSIYSYWRTTLNAGTGDDTIISRAGSIDAGAGNDSVRVEGRWLGYTLKGGTGNDYFDPVDSMSGDYHYGRLYLFKAGDGNDTITSVESIDTIQFYDGSSYETVASGNDVLVKVGNDSILLKNAAQSMPYLSNWTVAGEDPSAKYIINYDSNVLVTATFLNDTILNYGDGATLVGGDGEDEIRNDAMSAVAVGGDGADTLYNRGVYATVTGDAGDDLINGSSLASGAVYDGGAGSDVFEIASAESTVLGGDGVDYITASGKANNIDGGADADVITNSGSKATVNGDTGNDLIENSGANAYVNGGADDDLIINQLAGTGATLEGGSGNDTINNYASLAAINGNEDNDYIFNTAAQVQINGGAGDDTIVNSGDEAKNATITGGKGDDLILIGSTVQGNVLTYADGDGNDIIQNFGEKDVLQFASDVTAKGGRVGTNYVVTVSGSSGTSTIILQGLGDYDFEIKDGKLKVVEAADPEPYDSWEVSTVNNENNVSINPANFDEQYSEDFPTNYYIKNTGENVTIVSAYGDDSIDGSDDYGEVIAINALTGNDVFSNFAANDTIKIDTSFGNKVTAHYARGDDYIVEVGNDASIVLKGAAAFADLIKLTNGSGETQYLTVDGITTTINRKDKTQVNGSDGRDYIINTGANVTINGKGGNDTIYGSDNGERFQFAATGGNDLVKGFGKEDTLQITSGKIQSSLVSGNDVIFNVQSGHYSGSITLEGAGGYNFIQNGTIITVDQVNYVINRDDNVKVTGTGGKDYIVNSGAGTTISAGKGADTIEGSNFGEVIDAVYNGGANVITNFGQNDSIVMTSGTTMTYETSGDDVIVTIASGSTKSTYKLLGTAGYSWIQEGKVLRVDTVNEISSDHDGEKVTGTDGKDFIEVTHENVTVQAGRGNDTITGSDTHGELFLQAPTDGNDIIRNFGAGDTLKAVNGTLTYGANDIGELVATIKSGSNVSTVVLQNAGGARDNTYKLVQTGNALTAVPINFKYSSKDGAKLSGTAYRDYIYNAHDKATIVPGKGDDTMEGSTYGELYQVAYTGGDDVIVNFGQKDTLQATSGTMKYEQNGDDVVVSITSGTTTATVTLKDVTTDMLKQTGKKLVYTYIPTLEGEYKTKLSGTAYDEVIINTEEKVTISGGGGNDTITGSDDYGERFEFAYTDGNDVITNFGLKDTLRITSGKTATAVSGNDVIITATSGSTSGTVTLKDFAASDYFTLKASSDGKTFTANPGPDVKINTADKKKFNGTDDDDIMINTGQYVTVEGKGGNDTITGSDDYGEVFIFNGIDGDDIITNFGAGDTIKINSGTVQSAVASGNDYIITVKQNNTTGTLTLKDVDASKIMQKNGVYVFDAPSKIVNRTDNVKVVGSNVGDYIINTGAGVTINGGAGNDTISGSDNGERYQFAADGGQDYIVDFGVNDTLQVIGGAMQSTMVNGDDLIVVVKSGIYTGTVTLGGAAGYVFEPKEDESGQFLVVEQKNFKINREDDVKFEGTSKADWLTNSGANVTIASGAGKDTLEGSNFGDVFAFAYNNGNNIITNFGINDSLVATSGKTMTYKTVGDDVIVTIASGSTKSLVTLKGAAVYNFSVEDSILAVDSINFIDNAKDGATLSGSKKADYIVNTGQNVVIKPGAGADTITGSDTHGDLFQIAQTDGKNVITNFSAGDSLQAISGTSMTRKTSGDDVIVTIKGTKTATVTLQGAAGLDFDLEGSVLSGVGVHEIINDFDDIKVTGTGGRDYIYNNGQGVTVQSGKGNDTIEGSVFSEVFAFAYNSGKNVITNFGANDTLRMTSGKSMTWSTVGDDVVVTLASGSSKSTVTLQGAAELNLVKSGNNLYVKGFNLIENDASKKKITGKSTNDGDDYIVNTGEKVTIQSGGGNDTIVGSDQYGELFNFAYTNGNNVIKNFSTGDTIKSTSGTISYEKSDDEHDYIVSITKGKTTSTITLEGAADLGTLQINTAKNAYILRTTRTIVLNEAPASAEDYWFTEDEAIADSAGNDVDALMSEADSDSALGKLTFNSDADVLTSLEGVDKFEQVLASVDRKKQQK